MQLLGLVVPQQLGALRLSPRSLQRFLKVGQDMSLNSDELQEALSESLLRKKFQVPHFGVVRECQSFPRTTRERYVNSKHSSNVAGPGLNMCSNPVNHRDLLIL